MHATINGRVEAMRFTIEPLKLSTSSLSLSLCSLCLSHSVSPIMELFISGFLFDAITNSMGPEPVSNTTATNTGDGGSSEDDEGPSKEKDELNSLYLEDLTYDDTLALPETWFDSAFDDAMNVKVEDTSVVDSVAVPLDAVAVDSVVVQNISVDVEVSILGLRALPDLELVLAGKGKEKQASEHNDSWAMRRTDSLRNAMKWDMTVPLGDLPFSKLDELFSNFFARAMKVRGGDYPSETLLNIMNSFNRILRRASDIRALNGVGTALGKAFNINSDPHFNKTQMVLRVVVKKSAREGVNKKRKKVVTLTIEMESTILVDVDHQINTGQGCQKHLAFFCLVRLGIRGGSELWQLKRNDLKIQTDKEGRDFVRFEERESKNNNYSLERYKEEQFRKLYHLYEEDFVLCVKQYLRHMPQEGEGTSPDLFLTAIPNPVGNVWFNRSHKVSKDRSNKWLRNMLSLVGLPPELFSNRSGRATLVTRLALQGVLDEVGMMITGHHSTNGYLRYDRTQDLKMKAATMVSSNPDLTYEATLTTVSEKFMREEVVGNASNLKPLVERCTGSNIPVALNTAGEVQETNSKLMLSHSAKTYVAWNKHYDGIDWELALQKDPTLAKALGGQHNSVVSVGSSVAGNSFSNCTVHITVCHPDAKDLEKGLVDSVTDSVEAIKENIENQSSI